MPRPLTPGTSAEHLRKDAKRWLKSLRANDPDARDRLARVWPNAPATPTLRDVQRALALEHGLDGWIALKAAVADLERDQSQAPELTALLKAADAGDAARVVEILNLQPRIINERGTLDGHTGLRTALHFGVHHTDVVNALVARASVDVWETPETPVDETQAFTALHAAAFHGTLEAIDVLLKHGANPMMRDSRYGRTPLGWANCARRQAIVERLLGADLDIYDAIEFDRPEVIPKILERDPASLHRRFGGYLPPDAVPSAWCPDPAVTPLEWATAHGKVKALRILSSHGAELSTGGFLARTGEERVAAFLRMACVEGTLGGSERRYLTHAADRLLQRHPELARHDLYTAVVCGEAEDVRHRLSENPSLASAPGGPRQWPPLLYLCTARLPGHHPSAGNSVEIARTLLDRGADPNAYYPGGDETIHYTTLASVIGRGEEQAPTHAHARELAALLLERGAEPYDIQVLYNGFAGHASHPLLADDDLVWLLALMYQTSVKRGRQADWQDPNWPMLGMGGYGGGAWYLLHNALKGNYLSIAEWALAHGANPNPPRASDRRTPQGSLYEQAMAAGLTEFAELLARYGAPRTSAATDRPTDDVALLFKAAEYDQIDVARRALDAGVSPNVTNQNRARPLHLAAYAGSLRVVQLLIDRGADIDPRDDQHGTTPIYWALFGQRWRTVDLLTPHSRDVWALVPSGRLDRLEQVITAEPKLAASSWEGGTPLFDLPDDEEVAVEIVRLFLAHGADPAFRRNDGVTAEQIARARGLDAAADLLGGN